MIAKKSLQFVVLLSVALLARASAAEEQTLKYHDGKADGRKSLAGNGEIIAFESPGDGWMLKAVRVHGSRYGLPKAPDEDFYVFVTDGAGAEILHTVTAPYKLFERGDAKWVDVRFKKPARLPEEFCVVFDFKAHQTKGVYVSYDTGSGGGHSRIGLPGQESSRVDFGGDWMVEAVLERP